MAVSSLSFTSQLHTCFMFVMVQYKSPEEDENKSGVVHSPSKSTHPLVAVLCTGSVLFFSFLSLPWNVRLGHSHFDSPDSVTPAAWHEFRKQCEWFKNNENDGSLPETLNETVTTDTLPPPSSISDEILNIAVTVFPVCVCVCVWVFLRERESERVKICRSFVRRCGEEA